MKVLVTGGAGFIGSNFIRHLLVHRPDVSVINLDKLTYAGNLENLAGLEGDRLRFVQGDICDRETVSGLLRREAFHAVVNFAAESHVDRSIEGPDEFIRANYLGTAELLRVAKEVGLPRFLQVSTDEVYGSADAGQKFDESSPLNPSSPYAATKAAADLLVRSYAHTYGLPSLLVRCSNNYGPYQFPEKLIPLMICNVVEGSHLPVYGDGLNVRDWIYVEDTCAAIDAVLFAGEPGEIYNVGDVAPKTNLEVIRTILRLLGKDSSLMTFVKDRPGHDRRYAVNSSKLRSKLGWKPRVEFEDGILRTVRWYQEHSGWVDRCRNGEYRDFYARHYAEGRAAAAAQN